MLESFQLVSQPTIFSQQDNIIYCGTQPNEPNEIVSHPPSTAQIENSTHPQNEQIYSEPENIYATVVPQYLRRPPIRQVPRGLVAKLIEKYNND